MADLRFSNQGPIVLGLGGAYPNYASIPTVFGGPTQGILISVYNRGGAYVPNNQYNTLIPTTIGVGNSVEFSDYYTSTNYTTGNVPPVPNPRPGNNPNAIIMANPVTPYQAYIGDTYNFGSVSVKGFDVTIPITCSSVTISGQTVNNIASDQSQIQFVVTAQMNYDIMNPADVTLTTNYNYDPVIPRYFTRFPIDASQAILSTVGAMSGDNVSITGLRSLQVNPLPTVTIGGISQLVNSTTSNSINFTVNSNTPTINSNVVITNSVGDSATLSTQFKRTTSISPTTPADRGPPPNINWQAQDPIPETITITVSSNFTPTVPIGSGSGFVAISGGFAALRNVAATSSNGSTWTQSSLPVSFRWLSVVYGAGLFIALGKPSSFGATTTYATSSDGGSTWTERTFPTSLSWRKILFGNGIFLALADSSSALISSNGLTWTQVTLPIGGNFISSTFGNGLFVVISSATNQGAISADGVNWTMMNTLPTTKSWSSVAFGNGIYVALGGPNSDVCIRSTNGLTWTQQTLSSVGDWNAVAFGNGVFVALGVGSAVSISTDGQTWVGNTQAPSLDYRTITFGNGLFVSVGFDSSTSVYSSNGQTWSSGTLPGGGRWWVDVAFGEFPPATSYSITRPANPKYGWSALNLTYNPTSGQTPQQVANAINTLLLNNWGGTVTPTSTLSTTENGSWVITFNTNIVAMSNLQINATAPPSTGSITLTSSGGTIGNDITRIAISATGPIYIDSSYGYVNNLTFSHDGAGFDANSAVIPNVNQPSNIRELYNF